MVGAQDDAASTASNLANFQDDGDEVDDDDVEDGDGDDSGSGVGPEGEGVLADQVWSHSHFLFTNCAGRIFLPALLPATLRFRLHEPVFMTGPFYGYICFAQIEIRMM